MARIFLTDIKNPAMKGVSEKENMVLKLERLWRFFLIKNSFVLRIVRMFIK